MSCPATWCFSQVLALTGGPDGHSSAGERPCPPARNCRWVPSPSKAVPDLEVSPCEPDDVAPAVLRSTWVALLLLLLEAASCECRLSLAGSSADELAVRVAVTCSLGAASMLAVRSGSVLCCCGSCSWNIARAFSTFGTSTMAFHAVFLHTCTSLKASIFLERAAVQTAIPRFHPPTGRELTFPSCGGSLCTNHSCLGP